MNDSRCIRLDSRTVALDVMAFSHWEVRRYDSGNYYARRCCGFRCRDPRVLFPSGVWVRVRRSELLDMFPGVDFSRAFDLRKWGVRGE